MTDKNEGTEITSTSAITTTSAAEPAVGGSDAEANCPARLLHPALHRHRAFNVIGKRKLWFAFSFPDRCRGRRQHRAARLHLRHRLRGRHQGVLPRAGANGEASVSQVEDTFRETIGVDPQSVVVVGNGATQTVQIRSETLDNKETEKLRQALFDKFQPKGTDGKPAKQAISDSAVSRPGAGRSPRRPSSRWRCSWCWSPSTSPSATRSTWRSRPWRLWAST